MFAQIAFRLLRIPLVDHAGSLYEPPRQAECRLSAARRRRVPPAVSSRLIRRGRLALQRERIEITLAGGAGDDGADGPAPAGDNDVNRFAAEVGGDHRRSVGDGFVAADDLRPDAAGARLDGVDDGGVGRIAAVAMRVGDLEGGDVGRRTRGEARIVVVQAEAECERAAAVGGVAIQIASGQPVNAGQAIARAAVGQSLRRGTRHPLEVTLGAPVPPAARNARRRSTTRRAAAGVGLIEEQRLIGRYLRLHRGLAVGPNDGDRCGRVVGSEAEVGRSWIL